MANRIRFWVLGTLFCVAICAGLIPPQVSVKTLTKAEEMQSFHILSFAKTTAERDEAVGDLGIVLRNEKGHWVAIRYTDNHSRGWSVAVAIDSGGDGFVSHEHFCGRFKMHRQLRDQNDLDRCEPSIRAVETATTLEEVRGRLRDLGFTRVEPPPVNPEPPTPS